MPLSRLNDAALSKALVLTPENLARLGGISVSRAAAVIELCRDMPQEVVDLATLCQKLGVRMRYVVSGGTMPQVFGNLARDDLTFMQIFDALEPDERRQWFKVGKLLADS